MRDAQFLLYLGSLLEYICIIGQSNRPISTVYIMRNICLATFCLLLCCVKAIAQPACYFEHYSTEEGLPQYTVMDMLQDHKGFMWFATWDGFSKFDGNSFKNYKVQTENTYLMKSNRVEHIYEDKYGYIWLHSYDNAVHCFNPYTESFKGLQSIPELQDYNFRLSRVEIRPSGKVWLLSDKYGCICFTDSLFSVETYNSDKGLKGNTVYDVYEDSTLNSWILTDNGLCLVKYGETQSIPFFIENKLDERSQAFYSAMESDKGEIWFGSNKGRIWRYQKQNETFTLFEVPTNSNITALKNISPDTTIIGTDSDGFFVYTHTTGAFIHYNMTTARELNGNSILFLFFDSLGQLWFETKEVGVYKFDTRTGKIKQFVFENDDIAIHAFPSGAAIVEDIHGQIWVHPKGGGFSLYNKEKDTLEPFYNVESSPDWRFSNTLHSLFTDKQGNLWFCTRSHGLEKVTFDNNNFSTIHVSSNVHSAIANDVRAILQDRDSNIWIATKDRRLTIYDRKYNRIGNFSANGTIGDNQFFSGVVYCMMQDEEENIWLGTKSSGLFKIKKIKGSNHYQVEQFRKDTDDVYSISEDIVYSIFQDSQKNIWVGTYGNGLNLVQTDGDGKTVFINHRNNLKKYPIDTGYRIRHMSENKFGNICVGTTMGLIMFSATFVQPDEIEYKSYNRTPGNPESLGNNDVHRICNTQGGEMFLATFGGGLNKVVAYDTKGFPLKFHSYTMKDGLPTDVCLTLVEDNKHDLWISMENNLSKFTPATGNFETFSEIKRLMFTSSFSEAAACKLHNGELMFGFSNGALHFSPDEIKNSTYKPYIAFTEFRLHNQLVPIGEEKSPLSKSIDDIGELTLKHNQNSFSIGYAALDFILPQNVLYAHKLEGFDSEWVYAQKQRIANYTNIPKGNYVLRVKSTNSEGIWVENERTLPLRILPSFWETPVAYILYTLLFAGLFYLSIYILFTFYKLRKNVEMEKHLSEMKLRFFTDVSHEIRTPLTMIQGPVEYLLEDKDLKEDTRMHLNSISQNTNRMLRLVNQILDFRKVQHFQLRVQETDLGELVENLSGHFFEIAQKHQIDFCLVNHVPHEKAWVDRDSVEKVVMNLLSNAFKYTPDGKRIEVLISADEKQFIIEVKDEGKGIAKEKQKTLFTRFTSFNDDKTKPSTGIGLSIVKDLVSKHGGKVTVESELNKGSTFTVSFPKGINQLAGNTEIIAGTTEREPTEELLQEEVSDALSTGISMEEKKQTVLIVEDDIELRVFMKTILEQRYIVIEASNGLEGLGYARERMPDIIVSDIMMPEMTGIELLKTLKEDITTSHIPVILLTAKTTIGSKLEGLAFGADDYITKPFSLSYFHARIDNLLKQRKRLQENFRNNLNFGIGKDHKEQKHSVTLQDEMLMQRIVSLIEEHIDDNEFNVENLSSEVNMSRSVFTNKVKSLTGLPPFEFIRDIKIKRAAQLLASGGYMVKEVSSMIGISDTKHFGKLFKAKYGMTPQEYKNQS